MTTKQAEKDYLRRSGGGDWEASKPFPPRGQLATDEHAQHLLDFAVLLRILRPGSADLVLDLGAGSCWVSDWLRRCAVRTVALDIAPDMLQIGASRLGSTDGLVAGDMEQLPFADGTFSKACCLNAFHHVPDRLAALREIKRVLKPDRVALFSEPGAGHATNPTSVAASRNYGVLETEVLADDLMNTCLAAGFVDVRLHPISHVVPLFVLQKDQWTDWRRFTASNRPARALTKLGRGIMELFGLGKKDLLFEEAFAIRLLRELQPIVEQHPVVTAYRTPFTAPQPATDAARIELIAPPAAREGEIVIRCRVTNTGTTTWSTEPGLGGVRLGVQLFATDGTLIDRNFSRTALPHAVKPGDSVEVTAHAPRPSGLQAFDLKLDLVNEGVSWFKLLGSEPLVQRIDAR